MDSPFTPRIKTWMIDEAEPLHLIVLKRALRQDYRQRRRIIDIWEKGVDDDDHGNHPDI